MEWCWLYTRMHGLATMSMKGIMERVRAHETQPTEANRNPGEHNTATLIASGSQKWGGGNVTVVLSHFHCYLCGGSCTSPRASYMAGCISPRWIGSSSCSHFSSDSSQSDLWWAHIVFVLKNPQLSFNGVP